MNTQKPARATVRRTLLEGKKAPDALTTLKTTCAAGAQCTEVQSSPVASAALAELESKVTLAVASIAADQKAQQDARNSAKKLKKDLAAVRLALSTYETTVVGVANGDPLVITKAGLLSRDEAHPATPPLEMVGKVVFEPGKHDKEAMLRWPQAPGAAMYEVEVNFDPQTPGAPWTSLGTCTVRSKLVTAPTSGTLFLARVAAVASDGTHAEWSAPILAIAR